MFDIDETIDAFRRGSLDIDCKSMVLAQRKAGGEQFEGQGYIRQAEDGTLIFKIYVTKHNAEVSGHFQAMVNGSAGQLYPDEAFYDLEAIGCDGTRWTAMRILPYSHWDVSDMSVLMHGKAPSIISYLGTHKFRHYLRLHFFEEYEVPLLLRSETEEHGNRVSVLDRAEFEAGGAKFEVRRRDGSGSTIVEVTSETPLPAAFDLRIQEALQYVTAKSAFWRARLHGHGNELHLELSSPRRKSAYTKFSPPISPASIHYRECFWGLFREYLKFVTQSTNGLHWNPVAYHLHNACEATANSVDAWAVGISVAVEAIAGLIEISSAADKAKEVAVYQCRALAWLAEQKDLSSEIAERAKGQINAMSNKRPQDTLYALADAGQVEKKYVKAWTDLRNRQVHPNLQDLGKPTAVATQKLLHHIHKVEVLLKQLTFHLIGYAGFFTDYGTPNLATKRYPLAVEASPAQANS